MAAKLDIKTIEFRNFLSYGDYVTELDVSGLGPTLVTGKNGAGKTSFLTALIWCIFGRIVRNPSPGDKVVNWETKANCYVKVTTNDGWVIIRTRLTDNHNELLIYKDGDDTTKSTNKKAQAFLLEKFGLDYTIFTSSVFCGQFGKSFLEMAPVKRKEAIERLLGLDKINEYAKAAKEKCQEVEAEQIGVRSALNILEANLDKQETRIESMKCEISDWDTAQKEKIVVLEKEIDATSKEFKSLKPIDLAKIQSKWDLYSSLKNKISEYKSKIDSIEAKIRSRESDIKDLLGQTENPQVFKVPDLQMLREEHERADDLESKEAERAKKHANLNAERLAHVKEVSQLNSKIDKWNSKSGSTCTLCEQDIGNEHIHTQIDVLNDQLSATKDKIKKLDEKLEACSDPIVIKRPKMSVHQAEKFHEANVRSKKEVSKAKDRIAQYRNEVIQLRGASQKLKKTIDKAQAALSSARPKESLEEAQRTNRYYDKLASKIETAEQFLSAAKDEINPHKRILAQLETQYSDSKGEIEKHELQVSQLDLLYSHYRYIYRSYSDRRKIKSLILSELIPFLNDRIAHYLSSFEIDMSIKFSATLSNETDKWGYDFCSGGERKKIDLSIMFAIYDLYMSLYGQQCNIMVFDEVDSRLDDDGVQVFSDIITSYFGDTNPMKPDTIFVISHKPELKNLLPSQIVIRKENGFSIIDQS